MPRHINPTPGSSGFNRVGLTSIEGVEASDLPDKGRGTPDRTGGLPQEPGGDVGTRAMPDSADAAEHGHRKYN